MTNQVIRPPNPLRAKVGGGFGGIDANAIARAEEALKAMSAQFGQWLNDEVVRLDKAQSDIRSQGYTPETAEALYFRAHDLKGLGTTYEYPLVTRIAASLCRMLDDADKRMQAPWPWSTPTSTPSRPWSATRSRPTTIPSDAIWLKPWKPVQRSTWAKAD